jgi:hypothetical protein
MDGTTMTAGVALPDVGPMACRCSGRFQRRPQGRHSWAQLEHIYWFNVFPDRQVEFDRSSSPTALNERDPGRLEATQAVKEFVEQEIK